MVHVHTLCQPVMSFLVCELCELVATSSHFYISDFCSWNFLFMLFFCILHYAVPPTCICSLCVILAHALMNGIHQLVHAAPSAFLQKIAGVKSQLCSKWSFKCTFPENFWLLVAVLNATCIALRHYADWRKNERRRKIQSYHNLWFATLNSYYTLLLLLQTGAGSIRCSM